MLHSSSYYGWCRRQRWIYHLICQATTAYRNAPHLGDVIFQHCVKPDMGHHERDPHDKAQKKNRGGSIWPTMRLIYSNHHIQPIRAKRRVYLMVRMCWFLLWLVLIHCILACIFLLFELKASVSEFSKITRGQTSLLQGVSDV